MVKADLHIHSQFSSDGEFSLTDIGHLCLAQSINTFSITDHNSVKGTADALCFASREGLDFIPGIEIDCRYKGINLHLLGYQIDWTSQDFLRLEEETAAKVMGSFHEMIENIKHLGFVIDAAAVLAKTNGQLPTGELIAEVMLSDEKYNSAPLQPYGEGGARSDMPQINFYLDYFAQGKPAFVPIDYMSYANAVELIRDNGGIPIVAHPGLNLKGCEHVVEQLLEHGAAGVEVFNNYHNTEQVAYFATEAQQQNALMTCGSDFHGHTKPRIKIGHFQCDSRFEAYVNNSVRQILRAK